MIIKKIEQSDLPELLEIHKEFHNFPFPDLNNPLYILQNVVKDDKGIIMAGFSKITSEGIFVINKSLNPITITKAIKMVEEDMAKKSIDVGFEDMHVFADNDDHFINILCKLGFVRCTGFPMVKMK
jgi:hypothetical protein